MSAKAVKMQNLLVAGIDGRGQLALDLRLQVLELGVVGRRDLSHLRQQGLDDGQVGREGHAPSDGRSMSERLIWTLPPMLPVIGIGKVIVVRLGILEARRHVGEAGVASRLSETLRSCRALHRHDCRSSFCSVRRNDFDGAFESLEQVDGHQGLQALFAVRLLERSPPPETSVSYSSSYLAKPARQDVAHRRIDGELHAARAD